MADPFGGYPLPANVGDNDASGPSAPTPHKELHNRVERGLNELQATVTALEAQIASNSTNISTLQAQQATFSAAWTPYTPILYNVTVGTGSVYGAYFKNGRYLSFRAGFKLGSGFTMNLSPIGLNIPFAAQVATDRPALVTCYAQNVAVAWPTGGVGAIFASAPDRVTRIAGLGFLNFTPSPWNEFNPQVWFVGDTLSVEGVIELASV